MFWNVKYSTLSVVNISPMEISVLKESKFVSKAVKTKNEVNSTDIR